MFRCQLWGSLRDRGECIQDTIKFPSFINDRMLSKRKGGGSILYVVSHQMVCMGISENNCDLLPIEINNLINYNFKYFPHVIDLTE